MVARCGGRLHAAFTVVTVIGLLSVSVVMAQVLTTQFSASVFQIYPPRGSMAGGTYLSIKGVGFSRGGAPGWTFVFIDGQECIQNQGVKLDTTDTNYQCFVAPTQRAVAAAGLSPEAPPPNKH